MSRCYRVLVYSVAGDAGKEDDGQDDERENNVNAALRGGALRVGFWGHGVERAFWEVGESFREKSVMN